MSYTPELIALLSLKEYTEVESPLPLPGKKVLIILISYLVSGILFIVKAWADLRITPKAHTRFEGDSLTRIVDVRAHKTEMRRVMGIRRVMEKKVSRSRL